MHAFTKVGLNSRNARGADFATLDDVIMNTLGGKLIVNVDKFDAYSLVSVKGMLRFFEIKK